MSHTDKTDPYWVKMLHAAPSQREEHHGRKCNGDNCDIERSLLSPPRRNQGPKELRTVTREVAVPNPDYDPTDWDSWRNTPRFIIEENTHSYWVSTYDGPDCRYYPTPGQWRRMYACGCSWCSPSYPNASRAVQRDDLKDLIKKANSGFDMEDEECVFDRSFKYGWVC